MLNQIAEDKSLGGNLWKVSSVDERAAELMVQKCNLPYIVARILALRGIGADEVSAYLEPKIQNLMPNPSVLKDVEKAALEINNVQRQLEGKTIKKIIVVPNKIVNIVA